MDIQLSQYRLLKSLFFPIEQTWYFCQKSTHSKCAVCLVTQSCPALYDPINCSPPGSSVHGILYAKILKWVATPSSRDLPNPGIEPRSPALQADSLLSEPPGKPIFILTLMQFHSFTLGSQAECLLLLTWLGPLYSKCVSLSDPF